MLSALNSAVDVVCFLDAHNLYLPEHVASLVLVYDAFAARAEACDSVIASRHVFLAGHEQLRLVDPAEQADRHIDTNCMSFARSAAFVWAQWTSFRKDGPPSVTGSCTTCWGPSAQGARTGLFMVLYESSWSFHYEQAGLPLVDSGLHDSGFARLSQPSH